MIIKKADRIATTKPYYFATKLQEVARMNADGGSPVLNLGIGSPDMLPPAGVIATLQQEAEQYEANKYQSYKGMPELREAYAGWYTHHFQLDLDPSTEVLPLMGSKEGIMHISMSFLQRGDIALYPNPGYPAYKTCVELAGARAVPYMLGAEANWLPDLEAIAATTDMSRVKIMWINYPHMPTGAVATRTFYKELIAWARRYEVLICSDNPYAFILNDDPISPLQVTGAAEVCIELTSLSKSYNMAGWRQGALVGGADYIQAVLTYKSNMDSGMYRPAQYAVVHALSHGREWFASINETYLRRKVVAGQLMDLLDLTYDDSATGMFLWGRMQDRSKTSAEYIDDILQRARVFLTPGHIFGSQGEGYVRLSLCSSTEQLQEAVARVQTIFKPELV